MMKGRRFTIILITLTILLASIAPVHGDVKATYMKKLPYKFNEKPSGVGKPSKSMTSVSIMNIPEGETVKGEVTVIVEAKGEFASVELWGDPPVTMIPMGHGDRYYATWTAPPSGSSSILVEGKDVEGTTLASDTVTVTAVNDYLWEVYVEVDYIEGHYPSTSVFDYLVSYWAGFAVYMDYEFNDQVPFDEVITSSEFWLIESEYNDVWMYDDRVSGGDTDGDGYDHEFLSKEKWVLWGTWDDDSYVGGYTYVIIEGKDALSGNYIFIADAMIDDWEDPDMTADNGEVIVLAHELGHSIGILQLRGQNEKYDPDRYSIMSTMNTENALYMEKYWYYSQSYWATKNLNYYQIP